MHDSAPSPHVAEHCVVSPTVDHAGGAFLRPPTGTRHLTIRQAELRALDLYADAALELLDLRACGAGLHLTLLNPLPVRQILLPEQGAGAVLHIRLSDLALPLVVGGLINELDLAWLRPGADDALALVQTTGAQGPLDGAWIGPAGAELPDVALVLAVGSTVPPKWLAHVNRLRQLVLDGCSAPDGLDLPQKGLRVLLRDLHVPEILLAEATSLRLERCEGLTHIAGAVERVVMRGGGRVDDLRVNAYVAELDLDRTQCGVLTVLAVRRLLLADASGIGQIRTLAGTVESGRRTQVHVRGNHLPQMDADLQALVEPMTADDIYAEFRHGTANGQRGMLRWARECRNPRQLWLALKVLTMAVDADVSAEEVWAERCALQERHGRAGSWTWNFPLDLAVRGWTGDVRLWLRCVAAGVPDAVAYARVMACAHKPAPIASMMLVAASDEVANAERLILMTLCAAAMQDAVRTNARLDLMREQDREYLESIGLGLVDDDWMSQMQRALMEHAAHPKALDVANAMAAWIGTCAPTCDGVLQLGRLASHRCPEAREWLMRLRGEAPQRVDLDVDGRRELCRMIDLQLLQPNQLPHYANPEA